MKYFTITPETTPEMLRSEYVKLAKIHHPDTGGTKEDFQQVQAEYKEAIETLSQRPEYGYITETETFRNLMGAADDILNRFGYNSASEMLKQQLLKVIDGIKIPPMFHNLEDLKPFAKMAIEEKFSDPVKLASDIEKLLRSNKKSNKK